MNYPNHYSESEKQELNIALSMLPSFEESVCLIAEYETKRIHVIVNRDYYKNSDAELAMQFDQKSESLHLSVALKQYIDTIEGERYESR